MNDFGGWVGYEPVKEEMATVLNHHMYLFFQNEYHISQFAEGRKFVINVKDDSFGKVVDNARIIKAIVEYGTPLSILQTGDDAVVLVHAAGGPQRLERRDRIAGARHSG